jgi:hypothetical protein
MHSKILFTDWVRYVEIIRCDQLKNKSSRRVTCGNPCYSIGSKANSIYFLNDRSVCDIDNKAMYQ